MSDVIGTIISAIVVALVYTGGYVLGYHAGRTDRARAEKAKEE